MLSWARLKTPLGYLLTLALMVTTIIAVQSQSIDEEPTAEGRLSAYYGWRQAAAGLYPGDGRPYPNYPGDWLPLYPGDERWDGQFHDSYRFLRYPADVQTLGTDGQNIYVGGENLPVYPYDQPSMPLARWNNSQWEQFTAGQDGSLQGKIYSLAVQGNNLYAGGVLNKAGTLPVSKIAHWDGAKWDDMGGGVSGTVGDVDVQTIVIDASDVYAGGWFDHAGVQSALNIARWDGAQWHGLGGGVDRDVKAIAVNGNAVYAGGSFTTAGSQLSANHIAVWNGQTWAALGDGTDGTVNAIAVQGNNVYVAGSFIHAGGKLVNNIARWDGTQWNALGDGLVNSSGTGYGVEVKAIKVTPEGIYAGGAFSYTADGIALWDGLKWTKLGSGIRNGYVTSLEALNDQIFTAGIFGLAGNDWSNGFAIWHKKPTAIVYDTGSAQFAPGSTIMIYGQYFPPNQLVEFAVNGKVLSKAVPSNADGKVYIRLTTYLEPPTPESFLPTMAPTSTAGPMIPLSLEPARSIAMAVVGQNTYTLTANGVTASGTFTINLGARVISSPWAGMELTYPPYSIYLPVTHR